LSGRQQQFLVRRWFCLSGSVLPAATVELTIRPSAVVVDADAAVSVSRTLEVWAEQPEGVALLPVDLHNKTTSIQYTPKRDHLEFGVQK